MDLQELLRKLKAESLDAPKPIQEQSEALYDTPLRVPSRKRRKTDRRTLLKRRRAYSRMVWHEKSERGDVLRRNDGNLKWQFFKLRREMKRREKKLLARPEGERSTLNYSWDLSLNEWFNMWGSIEAIEVGKNFYKPAYLLRGRDRNKDVQLKRIDETRGWTLTNLKILYQGRELFNGNSDKELKYLATEGTF